MIDFNNITVEKNIPLISNYSTNSKKIMQDLVIFLDRLVIGDSFLLTTEQTGFAKVSSIVTIVSRVRKMIPDDANYTVRTSKVADNGIRIWKIAR